VRIASPRFGVKRQFVFGRVPGKPTTAVHVEGPTEVGPSSYLRTNPGSAEKSIGAKSLAMNLG
jgi:hypothetical protein